MLTTTTAFVSAAAAVVAAAASLMYGIYKTDRYATSMNGNLTERRAVVVDKNTVHLMRGKTDRTHDSMNGNLTE